LRENAIIGVAALLVPCMGFKCGGADDCVAAIAQHAGRTMALCAWMHTCVCVCLCVRTCMCEHVNMFEYVSKHVCMCVRVYGCVCT